MTNTTAEQLRSLLQTHYHVPDGIPLLTEALATERRNERARIREALPAILKREGFVRGVAPRYGTFNDVYWDNCADAILADAEGEQP